MTTTSYLEERRSGKNQRRPHDVRTNFNRDRARLLHSAAFRRLQAKTQVLGIGEGDFYRTRLTHTLEVAQIATGLVQQLEGAGADGSRFPKGERDAVLETLPDRDLIEAIAFAHDLGHPPFGHHGEIALNYMMRDAGGFEGNGQTLRLLSHLEKYEDEFGLDPTRRTLLGVVKYPATWSEMKGCETTAPEPKAGRAPSKGWKPPKCYLDTEEKVVDWLLQDFPGPEAERFTSIGTAVKKGKTKRETKYSSFDASIMEMADDIAYSTHDIEDAIELGLIKKRHFEEIEDALDPHWAKEHDIEFEALLKHLFDDATAVTRKKTAGGLIHALISSIRVEVDPEFRTPLLRYRADLEKPAACFRKALKDLAYDKVFLLPEVQTLEYRGRLMITKIFEVLIDNGEDLLPEGDKKELKKAGDDECRKKRVICDYIAGMTDNYAVRLYERLFVPHQGSLFEKL